MARQRQTTMPLNPAFLLLVVAALGLTVDALGQAPRMVVPRQWLRGTNGPKSTDADEAEKVFPAPPRNMLKLLSDARKLRSQGRLAEAIRKLGEVLESPEDFLIQLDKDSSAHSSLKAEAEKLLGEMPREGRDLYELQYGVRARQLLSEALAASDMERVAEVSRRFFHTKAGYQATFLMGQDHFDHGRPMAGALVLQRLHQAGAAVKELEPTLSLTLASCWLKAGMPEKAQKAMGTLRELDPTTRVTVAGRELPKFDSDAAAVKWLAAQIGPPSSGARSETDRWWMFRGDAARNAMVAGGAPLLNVRWRVLATDDPTAEALLEHYQRSSMDNGNPILPAFHPLTVGDVVLMRTLQTLVAVDFKTGKLLWEVPVDDPTDSPTSAPATEASRQSLLAGNLSQRMWRDLTFGTLSSDGRSVYSIEDLEEDYGQGATFFQIGGRRRVVFGVNQQPEQTFPSNRLTAHDIRTGKTTWELGGPAGPRALRQAETFFLGPPLPLMGQLYVLAEVKSEVQLLALDAATGNLLWSQQLAQSELSDPQHRWLGVSPSYADGILVCPTSTGAIVGVELATRSLLWGYCYGRERAGQQGIASVPGSSSASDTRWADASASIRDGRVFFATPDSDRLYCLNLLDGKLLWKCPRQNGHDESLYVASVDSDKVVLVGRNGVHAVRLVDGTPAWDGRMVAYPKQSAPSGRGFQAGNRYFLPLTSAEVVAIDLDAGKLVGAWKSRKGNVPGNLVCHKGRVLSQGADGVCAYYQIDVAMSDVQRRLAANKKDAEALSLEGEILLNNDNRTEAIAAFRRAYDLSPDERTRELLRDSLLEALQADFATYRSRNSEIERLLDNSSQRSAYLRAMGNGLRGVKEWAKAFDCYQQLVDLEPDRRPLDVIDTSLSVRRDRWIRGQLAKLRKEADPAAANAIDESLKTRLQTVMAVPSLEPLRQFVDYFGEQPAAAAASRELSRRLHAAGRQLEAELIAMANGKSATDVGKKKHEQAEERAVDWPTGKIEITKSRTANMAGVNRASFPLEWQSPHPLFPGLTLRFDYSRVAIVACDGYGKERWQVSLRENGQQQEFAYNATQSSVRVAGHLLLASLGSKLVAIDASNRGPKSGPRVLWMQDTVRGSADSPNFQQFGALQRLGVLPFAMQQQLVQSFETSGLTGIVSSRQICFQRLRDIVAVDPCTGETLWTRQGFPPGCEIFGDGQYVFVLSQDREEAILLDAFDGELLGTRKIPRVSATQDLPSGEKKTTYMPLRASSLGVFGRNLLLWWPEGHRRVMTLVDPLEGRDLWKGWKFAATAHASVVGDEAVGVMEPSGRFVLLSLPEGRAITQIRLQAEPTLQDISVFCCGDRYFLLTRGSAGLGPSAMLQPMPSAISRAYNPIHRGRLYAFDDHGKLLWPSPVVIEDQLFWGGQPSELPVLIFCCQKYEQRQNGQGQWKPSVLCVDKRTGKTAYQEQFKSMVSSFGVRCQPETKTIELVVQHDTIKLRFTDKPATPPPAGKLPSGEEAEKKQSESAEE